LNQTELPQKKKPKKKKTHQTTTKHKQNQKNKKKKKLKTLKKGKKNKHKQSEPTFRLLNATPRPPAKKDENQSLGRLPNFFRDFFAAPRSWLGRAVLGTSGPEDVSEALPRSARPKNGRSKKSGRTGLRSGSGGCGCSSPSAVARR